jgi:hypothetical protein
MKYHRKLEFYLGQGHEYAAFNGRIFEELYVQKDITDVIAPLPYFQRTWDEYLFFYHHAGDYLEIVNHFGNLEDGLAVRYYILYYLNKLLPAEYGPKDRGRYIEVQEDIVIQACEFLSGLYKKTKAEFLAKEEQTTKLLETAAELEWQYPSWDLQDFKDNRSSYLQKLKTRLIQKPKEPIKEIPYYELSKSGKVCARMIPGDYLHMLAYDIFIPEARIEPDLGKRILLYKKIRSDFSTIVLDVTTTNQIGKAFSSYFDISAINSAINIYIENTESAQALQDFSGTKTTAQDQLVPKQTDFAIKSPGKDDLIRLLNHCATQIEKWQVRNTLDDIYNQIDKDGRPFVFSNRFSFLQQLRIELENNAALFSTTEPKFREIEAWVLEKMQEKVFAQPLPINFAAPKITEEPADSAQILKTIAKEENKFWKGIPMDAVITHFEILTNRKNKNNQFFLTPVQLVSFLKRGFLKDENQPKQKISCSNGEKGLVIKRFYEFFELAVTQYGHTNKKKTFIDLFNNCFDNWEASTIPYYFKPGKVKEEW